MKNTKIGVMLLLAFLIILVACTKDFENIILDNYSFGFTQYHTQKGFIFESTEASFSVVPERLINTVSYYFSYEVIKGEGFYQNKKGNEIPQNQSVELDSLLWKYKYVPTAVGEHQIKLTSKDSNDNEETLDITYDIDYAPFSLILNKGTEEFVINSKNLTILTVLRDKTTTSIDGKNGQTFSINYTIENGTGEFYLGDVALESGKEYPFEKGLTNLHYLPTTLGTHIIKLYAQAPDNATTSVELEIVVKSTDFSFSSAFSKPLITLGVSNNINLNLSPTATKNGAPYAYTFNGNLNGNLSYDGITYTPGQVIPMEIGQSIVVFTPLVTGDYEIGFTAKDSNGVTKNAIAKMEVQNGDYSFSTSASPTTFFVSEGTTISLDLSQTINNPSASYEVMYTTGSSVSIVQDGSAIAPGVFVPLAIGATLWDFTTSNTGAVAISILVRDNASVEKEKTISLTVEEKDYTLSAIPFKNNEFINVAVPLSLSLTELAENSVDTYEVYFSSTKAGHMLLNSNVYAFGERFPISKGENPMSYVGEEKGRHGIAFTVISSSAVLKSITAAIEMKQVIYDFSASSLENSIVIDNSTAVNLIINETSGTSTYRVKHTLLSGSATLTDHNGNTVDQGAYVDLPTGTSTWNLESSIKGTANIKFSVINATGEVVESNVSVVVKAKDYSFRATAAGNTAFVGQSVSIASTITELDSGGETYTAYYTTSGTGAISVDGSSYAPGANFSIPVGSSNFTYTGLDGDNHDIQLVVTSSDGLEKRQSVRIVFGNVLYDFAASPVDDQITLGDVTGISLNINETSGTSTYRIKYTILSGSATLTDHNGNTVNQGAYVDLPTGTSIWNMQSNIDDTINIQFIVLNATGEEVDSNVSVRVDPKDYTFAATPAGSDRFIGESVTIATTLTEIGTGGETYTAYYSNSSIGTLSYGGVNYNPGEFFPITLGNNTFTYSGMQEGNHSLQFTVTSSKGLIKTASVNIGFNFVSYRFSLGQKYTNLVVGETASANFNITETSGTSTYKMSYTVLSGSPNITDQNGNTVSPGTEITVPVGGFTWDVTSSVAGSSTVQFNVVNATGFKKNDTGTYVYASYQEPFSLRITQAAGIKLSQQEFDLSLIITADDSHISSVNYTMSFAHQGEDTGYILYKGVRYNEGDRFLVDYNSSTLEFFTTSTTNTSFQVEFTVENATGQEEDESEFITIYQRPILSNIRTGRDKYNRDSCGNGCNWDNSYLIDFDVSIDPSAIEGEAALRVYNDNAGLHTIGWKEYRINPAIANTRNGYYEFLYEHFVPTFQALEFNGQSYELIYTDNNGIDSVLYSGTFTDDMGDSQ